MLRLMSQWKTTNSRVTETRRWWNALLVSVGFRSCLQRGVGKCTNQGQTANSNAGAAIYNADFSQGRRLLFAVNPTLYDVSIPLGDEIASGNGCQLADHERFFGSNTRDTAQGVEPNLFLPALGCGLWMNEG